MALLVDVLALLAAIYFLARFLAAVPLWPSPNAISVPLAQCIILSILLPLPAFLFAPATVTTAFLLLAVVLSAIAAIRFTFDAPLSYPLAQALFWRFDIALFAFLSLALVALNASFPKLVRLYATAAAVLAVAIPFGRSLHGRTPATSSFSARIRSLVTTALRPQARIPGSFTVVPPAVCDVSAFSLLSFDWVTPLVSTGRDRPLEAEDVHQMGSGFAARASADQRLKPFWTSECARQRPSLSRALIRAFGLRLAFAGLLKFVNDMSLFVPPVMLRLITRFLQERGERDLPLSNGIVMAVVLLVAYIAQSLLFNHYFNINCTVQALVRGSLVTTLYQKSCRLSPGSRAAYTSGQIQNLMSNDTRAVADSVLYMHMLWSSVLQVCVALVLLVSMLGAWPTFAGIACILATMPLQARLVGITKAVRELASSQTDERVKAVSEAVRGIKLVKLYAWELSFVRRILSLRAKELSLIRTMTLVQATSTLIANSLPTLLTLTVFVVFALGDKLLDASIVFPAIALFAVIRPGLIIFPYMLVNVARAAASLSRLRNFFLADELQSLDSGPHAVDQSEMVRDNLDALVTDASFSWNPSSTVPTLCNVSFKIPQGSLVAIVGPTGSGKSTLLASLLGEVPIISGKAGLRTDKSVAFCDQVPFIQNATVRDNILFGRAMREEYYRSIIEVCCLEPDLDILPGGDQTEIGGRGVNLSGGQRARVSLARAAYSRSDIILLDDPLSAVDAHVGKKLFHECIGKKLEGKTRLMTTNQIHFAASATVDIVVVVQDGSVVEVGQRGDLLANPTSKFAGLLESAGELGGRDDQSAETTGDDQEREQSILNGPEMVENSKNRTNDSGPQEKNEKTTVTLNTSSSYGSLEAGRLTRKERKFEGRVKWKHYKAYLNGMGLWEIVIPILIAAFVTQCFSMGVSVWLSVWSDASLAKGGDTVGVWNRLIVFVGLGFATVVTTGISGFLLAFGSVRASVHIHEKLILSVLGSTSSFFNSTPQGRLVNRFNSDMDKIDSLLGGNLQSFGRLVLTLIFSVAINIWAAPALIFLVVPIAGLCIYIQEYYRKTSVDLYRLESLARSPLYSHFAETLDGVMTIRAFGDVERGNHISDVHTDALVKATYSTSIVRRWLAIRLEAMGTVLVFGATIAAVLSPTDGISASMLSLVLSYTMQMLGFLTWCVRQFTETESNMNAVERVVEYSEPPFPQEERGGLDAYLTSQQPPSTHIDANLSRGVISREKIQQLNNGTQRKAARWPNRGHVSFENIEMRYKPTLAPALRGVSFTAKPGEHIGIVGRTGAGKSSAIQSLFRLYEPTQGRITIDGVDISTMRLLDLRSSIGIIPQEAVCFSGTIRSNLDMFGENDDAAVQHALDSCGLQDTMREPVGLDFEVGENGSNLSVGQRQLLCLGRALLKGSQVLVLDEATSSVSNEADEKIQQTLRAEMSQCTILTVAHRLHTVIQNDRIIVMEKGRIAEMGSPAELLSRPSMFGELVDETGPSTSAYLRKLAVTPRADTAIGQLSGANGHVPVESSFADKNQCGDVVKGEVMWNGDYNKVSSMTDDLRAALSDMQKALRDVPDEEPGEASNRSVTDSLRRLIERLDLLTEERSKSRDELEQH